MSESLIHEFIRVGNLNGLHEIIAEGADVNESFQVLTVTATGVPVWTNTIDGGTF